MHLDVTAEILIKQLGFEVNDSLLKKAEDVIKNTAKFDRFANHIFSLNDFLKHINAYIDFSNSYDYLKIKQEDASPEIKKEFEQKVLNWANKYNIELEKVKDNVYYIKGIKKD